MNIKAVISRPHSALLTALMAALLAFGACLGVRLWRAGQNEVTADFNALQFVLAKHVAHVVESYLLESSQKLQALAASVSWPAPASTQMREKFRDCFHLQDTPRDPLLLVLDGNGQVVFLSTSAPIPQTSFAKSDFFQWAKKPENQGKIFFSAHPRSAPAVRDQPASGPCLLATPLYRARPGTNGLTAASDWAGVMVLTFDLERLMEQQLLLLGATSEEHKFWMMDRNGTVLYQSEHPEMVGENIRHTSSSCYQCHASFGYVERFLAGGSGSAEYQLKGQPAKLAGSAPIHFGEDSWVLVVNASREKVTGFVGRSRRAMLAIAGLLVGAVGLAAVLFYRVHDSRLRAEEAAQRWQEKHRLEEKIRQVETSYRLIFEHSPMGVVVLDPETALPVAFNETAHRQLGYARDEFARLRLVDYEAPHAPEDTEARLAQLRRGGCVRFETQHRTREGGQRHVEVLMQTQTFGDRIVWHCLYHDVTDRKRAEESLVQLSRAVEQTADMVLITDRNGLIEYVNPAFESLTGYGRGELAGKTPNILKSGQHGPGFYEALWKRILAGNTFHAVFANRKKNGEIYYEDKTISPIVDGKGTITHFVSAGRDITERKRAEAELEKARQQLLEASRLAGMAEVATGVLHNVGNVLNSVNVSATLVSDRVRQSKVAGLHKAAALLQQQRGQLTAFLTADPKGKALPDYFIKLSEHLSVEQSELLRELQSLTQNIEHIKEIVAMQQSYAKVSGCLEPMPPAPLVEDALRINAEALARHRVEVVREFAEVPPVLADRHKVLQVLVNLISNAKYALDDDRPRDKRLTLGIARNGNGRVKIVVRDNGVGIAPENLAKIFQHGFTTKKNGHGFGLHSGALAATEMGGSLAAYSDGPGEGATFTLELPMAPERTHL